MSGEIDKAFAALHDALNVMRDLHDVRISFIDTEGKNLADGYDGPAPTPGRLTELANLASLVSARAVEANGDLSALKDAVLPCCDEVRAEPGYALEGRRF